ncbi:hypothetical protein B5X24_HaOG203833 [Helicoverpa armigera]|nr:hypothetical protein B5X24_HaOG203833 [Helicoverpa armigera]
MDMKILFILCVVCLVVAVPEHGHRERREIARRQYNIGGPVPPPPFGPMPPSPYPGWNSPGPRHRPWRPGKRRPRPFRPKNRRPWLKRRQPNNYYGQSPYGYGLSQSLL